MVGIYLNVPADTDTANYFYVGFVEQNGILMPGNILMDGRASYGEFNALQGGQILLTRADDDIAGHMTMIGSHVVADDGGYIANGDWYIIPSLYSSSMAINYEAAAHINSLQINGGGICEGISSNPGANITIDDVFVAYNCTAGVQLNANSVFTNGGLILIDAGTAYPSNYTIGLQTFNSTQMICTGGPSATGFTSSISGAEISIAVDLNSEISFGGETNDGVSCCGTLTINAANNTWSGIYLGPNGGSRFTCVGPLTINNAGTGIYLSNSGSFFSCNTPVIFNNTGFNFGYEAGSSFINGPLGFYTGYAGNNGHTYASDAAAAAAGVQFGSQYILQNPPNTGQAYVAIQNTIPT